MDGKTLSQQFLDKIHRPDTDPLDVSQRHIYDYLDAAACWFARETRRVKSQVLITTVAGQARYTLPPDFVELYVKNRSRRYVGKYSTDTATRFLQKSSFEKVFCANHTAAVEIPSRFTITPQASPQAMLKSTATAAGVVDGGEAILTDDTGAFSATICPRDRIHNTSKKSNGIILDVVDDVHLKTALFGGMGQSWNEANKYVILFAERMEIMLDPAPSESGHTFELPYVALPSPVYSEYSSWPLRGMSCDAISAGAAYSFAVNTPAIKAHKEHQIFFLDEIRRIKIEVAKSRLQGQPYLWRS